MDPQLMPLAAAVAAFVASHVVLGSTPLRAVLVGLVGRWRFAGLFSAVALATLGWAVMEYGRAPYVELWAPTTSVRHLALGIMPFACILVIAGASTPNPCMVGMDSPGAHIAPAVGILRITRHPLMWGIGLFAVAHMLANGDAASQILFGGVALLALGGTVLMDRKKQATMGEAWAGFAAVTSNLLFAAVYAGRNRVDWQEIGWVKMGGGLILYVALLALHEHAFGGVPWGA